MGRVDLEFTKLGGALVLDAPEGLRRDILQIKTPLSICSRSRTGRVDVESTKLSDAPLHGVSRGSCSGKLQAGKLVIADSSRPRTGRDINLACVQVVGDCALGWAEVATI